MKTMKKIMLFAAACVALAACNKNIDDNASKTEEGNSFEKGQMVTISVSAGEQTKVSSELVTAGENAGDINFKWQTGDIIKVSVGEESAEFELIEGNGTESAKFQGNMPGTGDTFDIQYPATDPDLTTQTYSATEALPHDKMLFKSTGCTSNDVTLTAQYAALRLNLYGNETVGKIVVTNTSSAAATKPTYTLNCEAGASIAATENNATPFFIIMPISATAADNTYKFKVEVFTNDSSPVKIGSFETSDGRTFEAGKVLDMPAKEVKKALEAPVISSATADGKKITVNWTDVENATSYTVTCTQNVSDNPETKTTTVEPGVQTAELTMEGSGEYKVTVTAKANGYTDSVSEEQKVNILLTLTVKSDDVVTNSTYDKYETTVEKRDWLITYGGNNKSVGTNSGNRSKCNLGSYTKYAVSPVGTSDVASAFACKTKLTGVSKIAYTFNGGNNQTYTNVYLIYSSDDTTFSQMTLTKGTQGATITSETEFEFSKCTGYFALLFKATNNSGNWKIDDVNITFTYEK